MKTEITKSVLDFLGGVRHNWAMPKRSRKSAGRDFNQIARSVVDKATGETPEPAKINRDAAMPERVKDPAAVALGRKGGLKGGKARAAKSEAKTAKKAPAKKPAAKKAPAKPKAVEVAAEAAPAPAVEVAPAVAPDAAAQE